MSGEIKKEKEVDLSRADKLLLVMYELSAKTRKSLRFEDIVVAAFQKYPDDFHLRGYPEFPDSGDLVHKPLYDFRKEGLVEAGSKVFTLTTRGLLSAERLLERTKGKTIMRSGRLSSFAEREILRIEDLEGLKFFLEGQTDNILDIDFFNYLGVTVRTLKNDFIGRLKTVEDAIGELEHAEGKTPLREKIPQFHQLMKEKFSNIIEQKSR